MEIEKAGRIARLFGFWGGCVEAGVVARGRVCVVVGERNFSGWTIDFGGVSAVMLRRELWK